MSTQSPVYETDLQWEQRLASEAFASGRHVPASFATSYDDGVDGCMPSGWYLQGLDANGLTIDFPVRHEYGPFKSEAEALAYRATVNAAMAKV